MKISIERFKCRFEQSEESVNVITGWTIEVIKPDLQREKMVEEK